MGTEVQRNGMAAAATFWDRWKNGAANRRGLDIRIPRPKKQWGTRFQRQRVAGEPKRAEGKKLADKKVAVRPVATPEERLRPPEPSVRLREAPRLRCAPHRCVSRTEEAEL